MNRLLLLLCILTNCQLLFGQMVNNTTLYVGNNAIVYSEVDMTNSNFFMNHGKFLLKGNWKNTGSYQGTGVIDMINNTNVDFIHNGNPINDLRVSGGARIRQNGKVAVSENMDFTSGIWQTSQTDTLLLLSTANVSGGSAESFVDGPLHSIGTGYRFFPIGHGNRYLPLTLLDVNGANPVIRAQVYNNLPGVTIQENTSNIYTDYYWQVDGYVPVFKGSEVTVSFPENGLRVAYLGMLYSPVLTGNSFSFIQSQISQDDGYWNMTGKEAQSSGYYVVAEHAMPVRDEVAFYFPNTLSPDAFNQEDRHLKIFGELISQDFRLMVFNRNGQIVYETNDLNYIQSEGWDGSKAGRLLPPGSYPYFLHVLTKTGRLIEQKGIISIIR